MIAAVEALLSIFQSSNSSDPMKRPSCTGETSLRWFPRTYSRFGDGDGSAQLYTIIIGGTDVLWPRCLHPGTLFDGFHGFQHVARLSTNAPWSSDATLQAT